MKHNLILVLNCGSSTIKFAIIEPDTEKTLLQGLVDRIGEAASLHMVEGSTKSSRELGQIDYQSAMHTLLSTLEKNGQLAHHICAIGHRVVHGGEAFSQSVIIDERVREDIKACIPLAPLHNPANLLGIELAGQFFNHKPQVAVFDTAFHQSLPQKAYLYALPFSLYEQHKIRRYGFHGTSHRYVTAKAAAKLALPLESSAFISAHLGNGCSLAAVLHGMSIDTSMGFTPLEGLVMGTRCGDIDPAIPSFLIENLGYTAKEVAALLNQQSGLKGLSQCSHDMRTLCEAVQSNDQQAMLAIDIFCYRLAKYIAAYLVALGRLDALIFTGGIGEHSSLVRAKTLELLSFLNFKLSVEHNRQHGQKNSGIITSKDSAVALVIPTNEEALIARDTYNLTQNA